MSATEKERERRESAEVQQRDRSGKVRKGNECERERKKATEMRKRRE